MIRFGNFRFLLSRQNMVRDITKQINEMNVEDNQTSNGASLVHDIMLKHVL